MLAASGGDDGIIRLSVSNTLSGDKIKALASDGQHFYVAADRLS